MKVVEPKVFKIAETTIESSEISAMLKELQAEEWEKEKLNAFILDRATQQYHAPRRSHADFLIEISGRMCYKSFGVGINPNITKVREDSLSFEIGYVGGSYKFFLVSRLVYNYKEMPFIDAPERVDSPTLIRICLIGTT